MMLPYFYRYAPVPIVLQKLQTALYRDIKVPAFISFTDFIF